MVIEIILEKKSEIDMVTKKDGIIGIVEGKTGLVHKENVSKSTKVLELGPLEEMFPCSESKILDFLVTFQDYDYSISDIATHSGMGFKTTLGIIKHLEDQKVIVNTRNVGRALMYKLNPDSQQAKSISTLALNIATNRIKKNKKINNNSTSESVKQAVDDWTKHKKEKN